MEINLPEDIRRNISWQRFADVSEERAASIFRAESRGVSYLKYVVKEYVSVY
jgi:hypothetical protein